MSPTERATDLHDELEPVCRAIAEPKRRRMLDLLKDRPRTTGELVEAFPEISRYAVMKHLKVLEEADLLVVRYDGSTRWNALNPVPLKRLSERWVSGFAGMWASGLERLREMASDDLIE